MSGRAATIPNALSLLRIACVPVFAFLFVTGRETAAVIIFGACAWTDFLDGYIARRTGSVTELGKLLDPLADRILIAALAGVLVARGALPWVLAALVVVRDVLVLAAFALLARRGAEPIPVNTAGKAATALLLFGLTFLAAAETGFPILEAGHAIGLTLIALGAALYWVATALYARVAVQAARQRSAGPGASFIKATKDGEG